MIVAIRTAVAAVVAGTAILLLALFLPAIAAVLLRTLP